MRHSAPSAPHRTSATQSIPCEARFRCPKHVHCRFRHTSPKACHLSSACLTFPSPFPLSSQISAFLEAYILETIGPRGLKFGYFIDYILNSNVSNFGIDCQNTFLYIGICKSKNFRVFSNLIFFSFLTPISRKLLDQSIQKFNTLEFKM